MSKGMKKYDGPKLFIGRLSPVTTAQSLRSYFERICPVQVVKVEFSRKSKNKKGFGYVIIDKEEDVERVLNMTHVIDHKKVDVALYNYEATSKWYTQKAESIKIKLRDVPENVSEQQISLFFERYAKVLVVNIALEKSTSMNSFERVALVELINPFRPVRIGKKIFTHDPNVIQNANFFSIENMLSGLSKPYTAPSVKSPLDELEFISTPPNFKTMMDFSEARIQDIYSKYEFKETRQIVQAEDSANYRFNLRVPKTTSAGARLLARRVTAPAMSTGTSLGQIFKVY